jgi:hypothetical protein
MSLPMRAHKLGLVRDFERTAYAAGNERSYDDRYSPSGNQGSQTESEFFWVPRSPLASLQGWACSRPLGGSIGW